MKYAYDYQNMHTRGWVRGEFKDYDFATANSAEAATALSLIAASWSTGTDLRLVTIADDGTEGFSAVTAKGSRGPLPKDR